MPSKNTQKNTQVVNVKIINPEKVKRVYKSRPRKDEDLMQQALEGMVSDQVVSTSTPSFGTGGASVPNQIGFANIPTQQQENPFNEPQIYSLANKAIDDRLAKMYATQNFTNIETPTDQLPITNPSLKIKGRPIGSKNKPKFTSELAKEKPAPVPYIPTTDEVLAKQGGSMTITETTPKPIKTSEFKQKRKYKKKPKLIVVDEFGKEEL